VPSVDFNLEVGSASQVVEVTSEAPLIDVTTTRTMTNVTSDLIENVPHGISFQSVIQFAPSARNEPLAGNTCKATDQEGLHPGAQRTATLLAIRSPGQPTQRTRTGRRQETTNIIGGYSHTNVPFDFIDEVQVKSSGIEAEHGGALGGV
jgi:hypothetical protein